jgi:hypothetical protein
MFREAWKTALIFENIRSAFAATAIYPLGPEKILNQLKKKTPSPVSSDCEAKRKTPSSVRGVRRAVKAIRSETTDMNMGLDLMIRASEKLVIRNDILEHEIRGLRTALIDEKKRRKRGKPMGLFRDLLNPVQQLLNPVQQSLYPVLASNMRPVSPILGGLVIMSHRVQYNSSHNALGIEAIPNYIIIYPAPYSLQPF